MKEIIHLSGNKENSACNSIATSVEYPKHYKGTKDQGFHPYLNTSIVILSH